jgi:urease accessory protein
MRIAVTPPNAAVAAFLLAAPAGPALAAQSGESLPPATLWEGLLAGLARPLLAPEHLIFVLALGIVAAASPMGLRVPAAFIAATLAGVLARTAAGGHALVEPLVAVSLLAAGLAFLSEPLLRHRLWVAGAAVAGLLHGYASGDEFAGAAGLVIASCLAGLAGVQTMLALAMGAFVAPMLAADPGMRMRLRAAGGALIAMGVLYLGTSLIET